MRTMTRDTKNRRIDRTPVTAQQALETLSRSASDARGVTTVFGAYLAGHDLPDPVAVSLALRARALLEQAVEHLDAATQRLEDQ